MPALQDALAAAARTSPGVAPSRRRVLVIGGGGPLGSAVLEALLATHRFERVGVVVRRRVSPALRGLAVVDDDDASWCAHAADSAVVVFDRERHANGRDEAFARPQPVDLPSLAGRLRAQGVRQLVVAVPHAPAMLPQALRAGLASLDEGAVAALGFEHIVFMRLAQVGAVADDGGDSMPQRVATWVLRQLHWMIPSSEQPVRAATVARVTAQLVLALPEAPPGTRVMPGDVLWHVAQGTDAGPLLACWLAGQALPPVHARVRRY